MQLHVLVENQVRRHLNVSPEEFEYLRHPSPNHLHDPFYYKGMRELVMCLHDFKQKQQKDPSLLLMVDGDYDTDGICAATILTAALSVFGFRFGVHIPSMEEGYGLSKIAIDRMRAQHEQNGNHIGMILTADNGVAAFSGIAYAKSLGIDVLVTDHHPAKDRLPAAKVIVDPKQPNDLYPFKGNSGGCVAWKVMLAYAEMYQKEAKPLIERLIVFAGMSNVGDVMPIRNENRYTVTAAISIVKDLLTKKDYASIANTPYPLYNAAFHGLYDLITLLQESKDEKRKKGGKKPAPLPINEELFSWYLSPILNAPRRVHDTCLEGLAALTVTDPKTRQIIIKRLIELNEEKSELRDQVVKSLEPGTTHVVLCVNTRKGISGLIAGKLSEESNLPSIVFSHYDPENTSVIYNTLPNTLKITGSARSNQAIPLNKIMEKFEKQYPGMLMGGGHETAAGFTIETKNYNQFCEYLAKILPEIYQETVNESEVIQIPENEITLYAVNTMPLTAEFSVITDENLVKNKQSINTDTFASDAKETIAFLESLRPYGEGFCKETKFNLVFDNSVYQSDWNPDFWKTFKFSLYGVEVLTFKEQWANAVKEKLATGETITASGQLKLNEFRGKVTPQLILSEK